jgi:hypothetical protein
MSRRARHRVTIDWRPQAIIRRFKVKRYYWRNRWHYFLKPEIKAELADLWAEIRGRNR